MAALLVRVISGQRNANRARMALAFAIAFLVALPTLQPSGGQAQEVPKLGINSQAYIVIDAETGEVYAQRNAGDRRAMASLTKVFTFIEAINRAPLDQRILITTDDIYKDTSTRVGFSPGELFTLQDLLYGMMLPSGNDAAHAIARGLGTQPGDADGDVGYARYIGWMNERILAMGLEDTNLVNPHGWGVPDHFTTAADLAAFVRYAILFPEFLTVTGTQSYTTENGYSFTNTNKLLSSSSFVVGGKTGYDDDAGYCLIEVAQRDGSTMISITLDGIAPDDWYDDNRVLLEYAFDQKAARIAAGEPISGNVVGFVDPGLVFLSAASSSAEIFPAGSIATQAPSATPGGDVVAASPTQVPPVPIASPADAGENDGDDERARGPSIVPPGMGRALLVAGGVALAFALLRGVDITRRGHRRVERRIVAAREADEARAAQSEAGLTSLDEEHAEPSTGASGETPPPASEPPAPPRRGGGLAARFAPKEPILPPQPHEQNDGSENAPPEEAFSRPATRRLFEPPPTLPTPTSSILIAEIPLPTAPPLAAFESPLLRDIGPGAPAAPDSRVADAVEAAAIVETEIGADDAALLEALAVEDHPAGPTAHGDSNDLGDQPSDGSALQMDLTPPPAPGSPDATGEPATEGDSRASDEEQDEPAPATRDQPSGEGDDAGGD